MAIGPDKTDPNYDEQMAKLKATNERVARGESLDLDKHYKSGPDQERRAEIENNAPATKKK